MIGFPAAGSWAESVAIPASAAIPVPPDLEDHIAAQLFVNYVTARMVLHGLRKSAPDEVLRKGAVLVTGASTRVDAAIRRCATGEAECNVRNRPSGAPCNIPALTQSATASMPSVNSRRRKPCCRTCSAATPDPV